MRLHEIPFLLSSEQESEVWEDLGIDPGSEETYGVACIDLDKVTSFMRLDEANDKPIIVELSGSEFVADISYHAFKKLLLA